MSPDLLNRRQALARIAVVMGGAFVGSEVLLNGATPPVKADTANAFSAADIALLDEVGDTIIPATDTPGAKATKIGAFMVMMVNECYDNAHHAVFYHGIGKLNAACTTKFGRDFKACTPSQRTALLNDLDAEQKSYQATKPANEPAHYFRLMKQLTVLGYFTSEIGATKALQFTEVPGRYDGNAPYQKGERNWFTPPSRTV